jgi:hypothetical protein
LLLVAVVVVRATVVGAVLAGLGQVQDLLFPVHTQLL